MLGGQRLDRVKLVDVAGRTGLLSLERCHNHFSADKALKEGVRRIDEAQAGPFSDLNVEVETPVLILELSGLLHECCAVQFSPAHIKSLRSEYAEQLEIELAKLNESNPAALLPDRINARCRSGAHFFRPVTERTSRCASGTTPANDNWHPVEAA